MSHEIISQDRGPRPLTGQKSLHFDIMYCMSILPVYLFVSWDAALYECFMKPHNVINGK